MSGNVTPSALARIASPFSAIQTAISPGAQPDDRYTLRYLGDPVLRLTAERITSREQVSITLLASMRAILRAHGGAGLAAPQVGVSLRLIVMRMGEELHVFLNPRLVFRSDALVTHVGEGCLSMPGFFTSKPRHQMVVVEYQDLDLRTYTRRATDQEAFAFQHEIDHLDGVLIIDGLSRQRRRQAERLVEKHLVAGGTR